ncbi:MAG: hypothetical protein KC731_37445, partial [Myxococcales bacterium]|nr:hypothetical protein [Myxococcales bacterium]
MRLALLAWTLAGIWGCASAPPSPVPAPGPTAARPSPAPVATPAATPLVEAPRCPAVTVEVPEVPVGGEDAPVPPVLHDETLAPFFEKVARLLRGQATEHLRIAVYGDSNLTMDFLSGQLRRRLQARHGDAGHGFVALGQPWSHYKHMDVRHGVKSNITSYACSTHPILDHIYGISGIAGESQGLGGRAWVGTARGDAPIGKTASRFEVYYLEGKDRGQFAIEADGKELMRVESEAPELG